MNIKSYTWGELQALCKILAENIAAQSEEIDVIVGISRGGVFPALLLAHAIDIRDIQIIGLRTTVSNEPRANREPPRLTALPLREAVAGRRCLLVDDITNTGLTMRVAKSAMWEMEPISIKAAAMVWDTVGIEQYIELERCEADFVGEKIHAWASFPWENQ